MTALIPSLSAYFVDGNDDLFRVRLAGGLRAIMMLLGPATVAYLILAQPLMQVLLEHGVAKSASADLVASVLRYFALGLIPFSAFLLLSRAFYARQDNRTTALWNILAVGVTVALDFALFPVMDVKGLALAHTMGFVVGSIVLAYLLRRRVGSLQGRKTATEFAKVAIASVVAGGAMLAFLALGHELFGPGDVRALFQLVLGGMAGLGTYLLVARALGVEDLELLKRLVPGRR
jgi:putative peptidoglycan lipid II flippase